MFDKDNTFCLSFTHFKKLMKKKTCSVSGTVFSEEGSYSRKVLCKKDQLGEWSDSNSHVVTGVIKSIISSGLNVKELNKTLAFMKDNV